MDYLYPLLKFIICGSVIVGVTLLAENVDARYGGMLAAPLIITNLAFLFTYSETDTAVRISVIRGSPSQGIPARFHVDI
jgi:hypothetical protein